MKIKQLFKRFKVHLIFGGGFMLVFAINVVMNAFDGQTVLRAIVSSLQGIRPMEYLMFALFWYVLARGKESDARSGFTTLNLSSKV